MNTDLPTDTPATPSPWPFPVWDGSRFACLEPVDRVARTTARERLANLLDDLGDAP